MDVETPYQKTCEGRSDFRTKWGNKGLLLPVQMLWKPKHGQIFLWHDGYGERKEEQERECACGVIHREVLEASVHLGHKENDKELPKSLKVTNW